MLHTRPSIFKLKKIKKGQNAARFRKRKILLHVIVRILLKIRPVYTNRPQFIRQRMLGPGGERPGGQGPVRSDEEGRLLGQLRQGVPAARQGGHHPDESVPQHWQPQLQGEIPFFAEPQGAISEAALLSRLRDRFPITHPHRGRRDTALGYQPQAAGHHVGYPHRYWTG